MSIPSFLRYPKFAASTGVNEFSHPNTAKFERNMAVQDRVIDSVKLRHIVLTLPGYETLSYAYDKTFWVDGMRLSYPIVICVGYAKGSLWASPDGNVIRETKKPFDEWSIFWTTDTAAEIPLAPFSKVPDPFDKCAVLRDGLKTPMGAESQALVRYYTTLRAQDSGLTKYSIEFPDLAVLLNVLRLLALPGGDDRYNFPKDLLEQGLKPQKVSELPPSPNAAKELLTQDCVTWSKGLLTTHNHMQTSSPKLVACNESLESPHNKGYTDEVLTKHRIDLAALLERKADIQKKIDERHKSADDEDDKANTMLRQRRFQEGDARKCLEEARRLRSMARNDQMEIDAIDSHLATALYWIQPTSLSASNRDHPTPE
ncbi:hypothetical protein IQ06DRAFT_345776 [Phaeosphaeriaceae sp. SRC1lsM3a]|nr:hypothetical protein IQ06DRAFT_345776 [Stagonospora sp. SRC1lsM3a]